MLTDLLSSITNFVIQTIDQLGYLGVAVLMAVQSAAVPIPSEVIMPFAGFLAASGRFSLFLLALVASGASIIGALLTYGLGFYGWTALIKKYGRFVLINEYDLQLTQKFFAKFGNWATLLGSMTPIVRTFISIPAGIGKVKLKTFLSLYFLGSFIWSYFLVYLGFKLGENWAQLQGYFKKFDVLIVILILVGIAWWIRRHFKR